MDLDFSQAMTDAAAAAATGDLGRAEQLCMAVLRYQSNNLAALNLMAIVKVRTRHLGAAAALFQRAITLAPHNATVHSNLGNVLKELQRFREAVACYDRALEIAPNHVDALSNKGGTLYAMGDYSAALESYDRAIHYGLTNAAVYYNRGVTLLALQRPDAALASLARAIELRPDFTDAFYNQGIALHQLRRFNDALQSYDRALGHCSRSFEVHNNRGNALQELNRLEEALVSYDTAIQQQPTLASAHNNRGNVLAQLGRLQESKSAYLAALHADASIDWLLGSVLRMQQRLCHWDGMGELTAEILAGVGADRKVIQPFTLLAASDSLSVQRRASEIFAQEHVSRHNPLPAIGRRPTRRQIRVGYYSADFHNHATSQLLSGLIELHDSGRFHVSGFSFGTKSDEMTQRLRGAFGQYTDVSALSDREVAELSRERAIDIAIDLKGFTAESRPGIFAHRAAPLQMAYLGYPGTMGATYIDYIIADRTVVPLENRAQYREKVIWLPNSYQVNDNKRAVVAKIPDRRHGLPDGMFIFCCLNACYKITQETFAGWMRVLQAVDKSVLWLMADNSTAQGNLRQEAENRGVSGMRLVFADPKPYLEHLSRYPLADLFLDTFPYGAHTTASDALWCGVPLITRMGESFVSRVGASLLRAIDLPELVTSSQEEYEALAISLGRNPIRMKAVKNKLEMNRLTTPLFDTKAFARGLETAFQLAYDRYQSNLEPDHMQVVAD